MEKNYELYHYGIKGQKWGVRRFQNPDGSLTARGEKRYYNDDGSLTRAGRIARNNRTLSTDVQREHLKKVHDSKPRKDDKPGVNYFSSNTNIASGQKYIKNLSKQIIDGTLTSFVEKSNGQSQIGGSKTKKGVVVRDKDGNRVTSVDYNAAQEHVRKFYGYRMNTGVWS